MRRGVAARRPRPPSPDAAEAPSPRVPRAAAARPPRARSRSRPGAGSGGRRRRCARPACTPRDRGLLAARRRRSRPAAAPPCRRRRRRRRSCRAALWMIAACGIDARALQRLHREPHGHERARPQPLVLVGELGLDAHRARAASTALSTNCSLPVSVPRRFGQHRRRPCRRRRAASASASPRLRCGRLKRDRDRVELGDRHQRRAARLHAAAGEDVDRAGAARAPARRSGVYDRPTCAASIAARSAATTALLRLDQRLVGVDRALRDEVLREQVACCAPAGARRRRAPPGPWRAAPAPW